MEKRLNIGLMTSHLEDDFADAVCQGAISAAKKIDANLIIIPGRYINADYDDKKRTKYMYQYNTLFSYAFPEDIDILIVLTGVIASTMSDEGKKEFLDSLGNIPKISLACAVDGYPSVSFDNKAGLIECIEHLIIDHGCDKIGFISGPQTNTDANERLEAYKEALAKQNIPFKEERVAYGNFSPYCHKTVEELLDRCPDLNAVVFANDGMASGAYEVFEKRGLEVGKDIYVTGFDDSPIASAISPSMTTVSANASELAYHAVMLCDEYSKTGKLESKSIPTYMVKRRSCGCGSGNYADYTYKDVFVFNHSWCRSDAQTIAAVSKYLFDSYASNANILIIKSDFEIFLKNVFMWLNSNDHGGISLSDNSAKNITAAFEDFLTADVIQCTDHYKICSVIEYLSQRFEAGLENYEDKKHLLAIFMNLYQIVMHAVIVYSNKQVENFETLTKHTNSLTKDMLVFDSYDDNGYIAVVDRLVKLNIASSYIYVFPETIPHLNGEEWVPPAKVLLKAYHNGNASSVVPSEEQEISVRNLFNNRYIPKDRRLTMVLSSIFLNQDHYGLFLCELEHEYFYYISALSAQICSAMKIIRLIQDKDAIYQELEQTLSQIKEKNIQLDIIAKEDVLTGAYNRRGFFMQANNIISSPMNEGREALIVFADLDSLKTINDSFSHEDGDFAIKSAARILQNSFRSSDVIGRIGGDEFSVLAMVENASSDEVTSIVRSRIASSTRSFNSTHDKPYIVHMSVGVYAFRCGKDVELSKILAKADDILYDEKKKKLSILR